MTIEQIKERIQTIRDCSEDDEVAHGKRRSFIQWVAFNPTDPDLKTKAELVLSTDKINFARWCA